MEIAAGIKRTKNRGLSAPREATIPRTPCGLSTALTPIRHHPLLSAPHSPGHPAKGHLSAITFQNPPQRLLQQYTREPRVFFVYSHTDHLLSIPGILSEKQKSKTQKQKTPVLQEFRLFIPEKTIIYPISSSSPKDEKFTSGSQNFSSPATSIRAGPQDTVELL